MTINRSLLLKLSACALLPILTLIVILNLHSAPDFKTVSGEIHGWKNEKWTLVNYFAEWCKPCLEELPELNKLGESKDLRVFGVSYDRLSDGEVMSLINKHQIQFPILTSSSLESLPIKLPSVLPTTYILSPDGNIVDVIHGKVNEEAVLALLEKHQKEKS